MCCNYTWGAASNRRMYSSSASCTGVPSNKAPCCAQDYLVAQGCTRAAVLDGRVESDRCVCFSQDGVRWLDLSTPPLLIVQAAALLTTLLSGDPAAVHTFVGSEVSGSDVR